MTTEYRRGIPSVAHVEAATRLGLEWEDNDTDWSHARWRFEMRGDRLYSDCALRNANYLNWAQELVDDTSGNMRNAFYRPIRTDGTPVDWEVLDAEVARAVQQAQPHRHVWIYDGLGGGHNGQYYHNCYCGERDWFAEPVYENPTATVTPTVSAAPTTQPRGFRADLWRRIARLSWGLSWRPEEDGYGVPLRNFAAVLDAVAEQRVAARQGQAQPNTVTLSVGPSNSFQYEAITASPEPRSFADVRPDRQGWRWWLVQGATSNDALRDAPETLRRIYVANGGYRWTRHSERTMHSFILENWLDRTVIPTDEQGNPVSWETIGQGRFTPEEAQRVEAAVADAIQNRLTQSPHPRTLNLDDLTTLLRRYLGDDVSIVSLRRPRGVYRVQIDFADDTRTAGITAQNLPHNVSIWRSTRGRTCDFDLRGTDASTTLVCNLATHPASAATSQPTYFAVDGDTMTTPSGAPPWLHQMCAEMRATATWCRTKASFALVFELAYGQTLEKSMTVRAVRNISLPGFPTVTVTATNRPAPPVPVCLVAAMRRNQDLAALQPDDAIPGERDATVAWAQMDPTTSQLCRNVVREIVEHGCYGLDDAAAAKRAGHYATLIAEAAAAKVETSSHVRAWCAQFQTRVALLEVDEGEVVNSAATSATLRLGTKPPTPAAIAKFRELMSSKMCPGRTEATKQSGLDCEATQHVLLRWCSGLDDAAATEVVGAVWRSFGAAYSTHQPLTRIDAIAQAALPRPALDVSGATTLDPALERARQAQEARRRSLAELQAQLQRERALRACADVAAAVEQPSRFALLEVDEAADPAASIARWQAGRAAAAGRRSVDVSPTAAKWQPPTAALHRIDFDVPVRHDYVDVSDMPIEVQGAVIIETLVDVARRAGGMWEN